MMKLWIPPVLAFLLLCSLQNAFASEAPSGAPTVDMQQSLEYAFAYSPRLQSMQESRQEKEHLVRQAEAGYYPTIGIWAGAGMIQEDSVTTRMQGDVNETMGNATIGFLFSQTIWQGAATSSMVRSRKSRLEASVFDILDSATLLAYNTISAHADVIRRRTLLELAQNNVDEHTKILQLLRSRFAQGLSSKGDLEQVVGRLSRSKATRAAHQEGLYAALASYQRLTGQPASTNLVPVSDPSEMFENTESVRELSVAHNFSLQSKIAQIDALVGERDYSRSFFSPHLTFDTGPGYQNTDRGGNTQESTWTTMLNMRWNIYNGGADRANFEASVARVREARKSLYDTMDILDEQINLVFSHTTIAREQAVYFDEASKASLLARENFFIQFQAGQKDLLNVLDAETEHFTSAVENIVKLTDATLGQYRLYALAGTLLPTVNIDSEAVSMDSPVRTADDGDPWAFAPSPREANPLLRIK